MERDLPSEYIQFAATKTIDKLAVSLVGMLIPHEFVDELVEQGENYADTMKVRIVDEEDLYGVVPALVRATNNRKTKREILIDNATVKEFLTDVFNEPYEVTADDIVKLYVGSALAEDLFHSRLNEIDDESALEAVMDVFARPEPIDTAIRTSSEPISEEAREMLLEAMMYSDAKRISIINGLRFYFGVIFMNEASYLHLDAEEQDEGYEAVHNMPQKRLMDAVQAGIDKKLTAGMHAQRIKFVKATTQSDYKISKTLSDVISEIEIAAAFPMSLSEIEGVLEAAT